MFVSYINVDILLINIKTCDKYDGPSLKEQIKTFLGGGGGIKKNYVFTTIFSGGGERK